MPCTREVVSHLSKACTNRMQAQICSPNTFFTFLMSQIQEVLVFCLGSGFKYKPFEWISAQ